MKRVDLNKYCPYCDYNSIDENFRGNHSICPIFFGEDDPIQFDEPNMKGGANRVSLSKGQLNYEEFDACEKDMIRNVRMQSKTDKMNPEWIFLNK